LHSLRRFVKTVISDQTNTDYSEWFLGHNKSPYYTRKEPEKREIYASKCMKYLTFLDYSTLEATGKNIEAKLSEKEKEIQLLRQRDYPIFNAYLTIRWAISPGGDWYTHSKAKVWNLDTVIEPSSGIQGQPHACNH
jgi:hypothetical protein